MPALSVVVPMLDEQAVVDELVARVLRTLADAGIDGELWIADDGSTDETAARAEAGGARVLRLPHRHGQLGATLAGLRACGGEWVAVLDGDLQDPPEALADLWAARRGHDVVYAVKASRAASPAFRAARAGYGFALRALGASLPPGAGSYLLARREVADRVVEMGITEGNLAVLVAATGPRWTTVRYAKAARVDDSRVGRLGILKEGAVSLWWASPLGRRRLRGR